MSLRKKKGKDTGKEEQISAEDFNLLRRFINLIKPLTNDSANVSNQREDNSGSDSDFTDSNPDDELSDDSNNTTPTPTRVTRSTTGASSHNNRTSQNLKRRGSTTSLSRSRKERPRKYQKSEKKGRVQANAEEEMHVDEDVGSDEENLVSHVDPQDLPETFDGNLDEEHRHRFNLEVFGNSFADVANLSPESGVAGANTKFMSRSQMDHEIYIKRFWSTGDPRAKGPAYKGAPDPRTPIGFRKLYPQGRNAKLVRREVRSITLPDGTVEYLLYDRDLRVVAVEDVFDTIREKHIQTGHKLSEETTYNLIKNEYHNITIRQVKSFIKGCPQCMLQRKKTAPHKGASKPIRSFGFRDRFQADLILMDEEGKTGAKDIYGVEMHYILSCKDHFSQFVMLAAVPSKSPTYIAHQLGNMFGIVGFPAIYQSDNGSEVCGNEVISMLLINNPYIHTCTGRPRTPREQGSVENANRGIRNAVQSIVAEEWAKGNNTFNWTMALGRTMSALNGVSRRTTAKAISSYETVFGAQFGSPFSDVKGYSREEINLGKTAVERCRATGSQALTEKFAICGEITPDDLANLGELATSRVRYLMELYQATQDEVADEKFLAAGKTNSNENDQQKPMHNPSGEEEGLDHKEPDIVERNVTREMGLFCRETYDSVMQTDRSTSLEELLEKETMHSSKSSQESNKIVQESNKSVQETKKSAPKPDKSVQKPGKSVQKPGKSVQKPGKSVQKPGKSVQKPGKSVQESNKSVQESNKSVQESNKSVQDSDKSVQDSSKSVQESDKSVKESNKSVQKPGKSVQKPGKSVQDSDKSVQESNKSVQESNKSVQESNKSVQESNKSVQDSNKSVQDSNKSVQKPGKSVQESDKSVQESNKLMQESDKLVQHSNKLVQKPSKLVQDNEELRESLNAFHKSLQRDDTMWQKQAMRPSLGTQDIQLQAHELVGTEKPLENMDGMTHHDNDDESIVVVEEEEETDYEIEREFDTEAPMLCTVLRFLTASDKYQKAEPKDRVLQVRIYCVTCPVLRNRRVSLDIPSKYCLRHYFGPSSTAWLPDILVHSFGVLSAHWHHRENVVFYDVARNLASSSLNDMRKVVGRPSLLIKKNPKINELIVLAMANEHYVILQVLLPEKKTIVYDGMEKTNHKAWSNVTKFVLWKFGIQGLDNVTKPTIIKDTSKKKVTEKWVLVRDYKMIGIQRDSHSCGPIAILVIACLFHTSNDKENRNLSQLHPANMNRYQWRENAANLFRKYICFAWNNLYAQKYVDQEQRENICDINTEKQCNDFLDAQPQRRSNRNISRR